MKQRPDNWNRIYSRVLEAERDFGMLRRGDRVLLGISGGSDSLVLLDLLAYQRQALSRRLGITVTAAHVPGRYRGRPIAPAARLATLCRERDIPLVVAGQELRDDTFLDCFSCARARRRILFDLAMRQGCGTLALGHNADDLAETALLNILYAGHFAALLPRQQLLK
ncbi:MAG TPA: ATP-binding protein, partial [Candidatus Edwardsbacteria bacterium]|nr:ATP-binding protein [Candidatus Edwardsbacteria bacterium]